MELVEDGEETGFWLVVLGSEAPGEHVGIRQAGDTAGGGGRNMEPYPGQTGMEAGNVLSLQSKALLTCC